MLDRSVRMTSPQMKDLSDDTSAKIADIIEKGMVVGNLGQLLNSESKPKKAIKRST